MELLAIDAEACVGDLAAQAGHRDQFQQITQMIPSFPEELAGSITSVEDPLQTAYTIANFQRMDLKDSQEILTIDSVAEKLKKLIGFHEYKKALLKEGFVKGHFFPPKFVNKQYFLLCQLWTQNFLRIQNID